MIEGVDQNTLYYVIGFLIVSNLSTLGTVFGFLFKFFVDYRVLTKDVSRLEKDVEGIRDDLNAAFVKIRDLAKTD